MKLKLFYPLRLVMLALGLALAVGPVSPAHAQEGPAAPSNSTMSAAPAMAGAPGPSAAATPGAPLSDHAKMLLLHTAISIVGLIVLIMVFRLHPFIALTIACLYLGLAAGMPLDKIISTDNKGSYQVGFGDTAKFVGVVLGLGTMLGKMMAESGGVDQIADTLLKAFGEKRAHWAMLCVSFLVGIPLFYEVGFVLLIPLVFIVAKKANMPLIKVGIPLMCGLSIMHGLIPPHPGATAAAANFNADIGKTILLGVIVGLPTAILCGPIFSSWVSKRVTSIPNAELAKQIAREPEAKKVPGFGITVLTVFLPVILMLLKSIADIVIDNTNAARLWLDFLGSPIMALFLGVLLSFYTFGIGCGFSLKRIQHFMEECLGPIAGMILIIGAGGSYKQILIDSHIGDAMRDLAMQTQANPLLVAWLAAAVVRVATGSATVAITTGSSIAATTFGLNTLDPGSNPLHLSRELMVLAAGSGSLTLSHVNDPGFWLAKQYFNLSMPDTFKTWTVLETLVSVLGLVFVLILSKFV